jgi:hypothetical protein
VEDIDFGVGFVAGNSKKIAKKNWVWKGKNESSPECVHTWAKRHRLR